MFVKLRNSLANALFPARCAYCGEVITGSKTTCDICAKKLKQIETNCLCCGYDKKDCVCGKKAHHYKAITAPFYYQGLPEQAVKSLKFSGKAYVADEMSHRIAEKVKADFKEIPFDVITSVPLFWRRKQERGFNQTDLIAKQVGQRLAIPFCPNLVKKIFETKPQHDLPAKRREGNVIGAFNVVKPELVKDKTILLIDDVSTTGATLNECARTLKIYGAAEIYCAAFAVTKLKYSRKTRKK